MGRDCGLEGIDIDPIIPLPLQQGASSRRLQTLLNAWAIVFLLQRASHLLGPHLFVILRFRVLPFLSQRPAEQ
jgi:hypothetical protein